MTGEVDIMNSDVTLTARDGGLHYFIAKDIVDLGSLEALRESKVLEGIENRDEAIDQLWSMCQQHMKAVERAKELHKAYMEELEKMKQARIEKTSTQTQTTQKKSTKRKKTN